MLNLCFHRSCEVPKTIDRIQHPGRLRRVQNCTHARAGFVDITDRAHHSWDISHVWAARPEDADAELATSMGTLMVDVISASEILSADPLGLSDPYVEVLVDSVDALALIRREGRDHDAHRVGPAEVDLVPVLEPAFLSSALRL